MTKSKKNKYQMIVSLKYCITLILLVIYQSSYAQNSEKNIQLNDNQDSISILSNGRYYKFKIPEFDAYEKVKAELNNADEINVHYFSSHVSTIDLYFSLEKEKNLILNSYLLYSPCQTCNPSIITSCENQINKKIEDINDEELQISILERRNCRTLKNDDSILTLSELKEYVDSIRLHEKALRQETINQTIENYPPSKRNKKIYNGIFSKLKTVGFDLHECKLKK